jgi:hypothetical protein
MKHVIALNKFQSPLCEMRPVSCISDGKGRKESLSTVLVGMQTADLGLR